MASFVDQFALNLRQGAPTLKRALSAEAISIQERNLKAALLRNWHSLPTLEAHPLPTIFAVDGSSAIRHLNNGWSVIIAQALAVGPEYEEPLVDVRFVRSSLSDDSLFRLSGLLMRSLELKVALTAALNARGGLLCLDGSLQTGIPHCLYPLDIPGERDLPLSVLETYLDLVKTCQERGIMLIALSKTSTASFFVEALVHMASAKQLETDVDLSSDPDRQALLSDAEVIFRWTSDPGYSTPLMLGVHGLGHRRAQLLQRPEAIATAFEGSKHLAPSLCLALLRRLQDSPATLAFHLRLRAGEESLRVDIPASLLGLPYTLSDFYLHWGTAGDALPALAPILASHGGPTVYHAAAYVADRLVRLTNRMVDGPYLAIMRQNLGQYIQYNRSQRRFS